MPFWSEFLVQTPCGADPQCGVSCAFRIGRGQTHQSPPPTKRQPGISPAGCSADKTRTANGYTEAHRRYPMRPMLQLGWTWILDVAHYPPQIQTRLDAVDSWSIETGRVTHWQMRLRRRENLYEASACWVSDDGWVSAWVCFVVFVLFAPPPPACRLPGQLPVPASSEHPPHQQSPRPSSISPKNSTIPAPRRRGRNSRAATATRIHLAAAAVGSRVAPALPAAADGPEPAVGGIATDRDRGRNRNI